ncbi:hypothetical protein VNO78_27725 [Psophocarpus tetragonolobus]|uniref:Uncharacterized protein n=1 Tax=Psophocarpus tetragonolobus TaxID=3891 RepID=A0AAN9S390_PSOTE
MGLSLYLFIPCQRVWWTPLYLYTHQAEDEDYRLSAPFDSGLRPICYRNGEDISFPAQTPIMVEVITSIGKKRFYGGKFKPNDEEIKEFLAAVDADEVVWRPYPALLPIEKDNNVNKEWLGCSMTMAIGGSYAFKHLPHYASRQFIDEELNMDRINKFLSNLPATHMRKKGTHTHEIPGRVIRAFKILNRSPFSPLFRLPIYVLDSSFHRKSRFDIWLAKVK